MRLLLDEDLNNNLMRGLIARQPDLDVVRAQDVIQGRPDDYVLQWASENERILITHDIRSIPTHCQTRWENGLSVAGIIYVEQIIPIGQAVERILELLHDYSPEDWVDRTAYVTRGAFQSD